jgi:alpha-L-rhamnosidase
LQIRQGITLVEPPVRARLFASARGIYQAEVNGEDVGDEVLAPGYDAYPHRLSFQCRDVTYLLIVGENIVGMTVADGWWADRHHGFPARPTATNWR